MVGVHRPGPVVRTVRGIGWTLIATGVLIALYVVYLLFFTNLETNRAQVELLDQWELQVGSADQSLPGEGTEDDDGPVDPVSPGDAYAAMWFERDGERIVTDDPLFVVSGTDLGTLRRGPGHYTDTVAPGQPGNFAVAGHRTTYGAPFYHLDLLQEGDEIHVIDRQNRRWVYAFREQRIVRPQDIWVVGNDPFNDGATLITLTTCHPRLSAAQRMIVWGELIESPETSPDDA
jgi:sortase A